MIQIKLQCRTVKIIKVILLKTLRSFGKERDGKYCVQNTENFKRVFSHHMK